MDGTVLIGREEAHAFMRHGADALRRTLEGQDNGPSDVALVPVLVGFFNSGR